MLGIVPVSLQYFVTSMRDYEVLKTGYLSIISRICSHSFLFPVTFTSNFDNIGFKKHSNI